MADQANIIDSEEWRPIPGWEGYEASSLGRIRSLDRVRMQPHPRNPSRTTTIKYPGKIRTANACPSTGYLKINLDHHNPRFRRTMAVNVLVCLAFHGPRPEGHDAAHWDGDRLNNKPRNLRWATRSDNLADRERHGTVNRGERNGQAKLTDAQMEEIRRRRAAGEMVKDLAREFGVGNTHLSSRLTGRRRK